MITDIRDSPFALHLQMAAVSLLLATTSARAEVVEIRPTVIHQGDRAAGVAGIEYRSGDTLVARSTAEAPAGVALKVPGGEWKPVTFGTVAEQGRVIVLGPETVGPLRLRWTLECKTPSLVERVLEVTADAKPPGEGTATHRFTVAFPLDLAIDGQQASFSGPEAGRIVYDGSAEGLDKDRLIDIYGPEFEDVFWEGAPK